MHVIGKTTWELVRPTKVCSFKLFCLLEISALKKLKGGVTGGVVF
jgi:hypothetical protein